MLYNIRGVQVGRRATNPFCLYCCSLLSFHRDSSLPRLMAVQIGQRPRKNKWRKKEIIKRELSDIYPHPNNPRINDSIAENVKGLIRGNAKGYVNEIIKAFREIGYTVQIFLLDAQTMGVPQRRERVFFIAYRNDRELSKLEINIHGPVIKFGEVRSEHGEPQTAPLNKQLIEKRRKGDVCFGDISKRERGKWSMYTHRIDSDDCVASTNISGSTFTRFYDGELYSKEDFINTQTFPQDYDFEKEKPQYVCGMSVPPVMMAQISTQVYEQWLRR